MEIWKDIKGYEELYQVSNLGRVKSLKRKGRLNDIILKTGLTGTTVKYKNVGLNKELKLKTFYVHRLVAIHFIRMPEVGEECNHIDFNPLNNNVDNLQWLTSKENSLHSRHNTSLSKQGEKHPKSKISDNIALEIKRMRKQKIRCKIIAEKFGVTVNDVRNISTRYYKHLNHLI